MSTKSPLPSYLLALAAGLLLVFWLFPIDFIAGKGPRWAAPGGSDVKQNVIGMRYFLADEWRFPLFQTRLVAAPEGINIIYTDSLPLLAVGAKLVQPLFSEQLNYFGIWYLLTYVLQGIAAVFLLRSLGVKDLLPNLAGAIISLSFPPFLYRVGNAALCGHFLIMFALGLYFRSVRQLAFGRLWPWLALLCWLALFVHAYLFVMVFGIFVATATQEAYSSRSGFRKTLIAATSVVGVSTLLMWVSGYFLGAGTGGAGGFGQYSMNVLSAWVPQRSGLFPTMDRIIDGTGGQADGFSYLGFGVLLLAATVFGSSRSEIVSALRRYWGLVVLLLGLTLLAISHRVFIGEWMVLRVGANPSSFYVGFGFVLLLAPAFWSRRCEIALALCKHWRLVLFVPGLILLAMVGLLVVGEWSVLKLGLEQFRSSGRLFWPVGYTIMAAGLVIALKLRRPLNFALVMAAAALQFIDARPFRNDVTATAYWNEELKVPAEPWHALIAAHERLTIVPSYDCAGSFNQYVLDLVFHASSSATPVNTAYLARRSTMDCIQESASLDGRQLGDRELLVVLSPPLEKVKVARMRDFESVCRSFAGGFACSRQWFALRGEL